MTFAQRTRLNELLRLYRQGIVCQARVLQVAVAHGLRPPLN